MSLLCSVCRRPIKKVIVDAKQVHLTCTICNETYSLEYKCDKPEIPAKELRYDKYALAPWLFNKEEIK